jgi:threonine dehydrogenase-like Zn-dependent dehydrogenase
VLAVHLENGAVSVRRHPTPRRPAGHALIRLLRAGICNTDLELQRGYYGFKGVPGHEFVGVVEEADSLAWIGKTVVGEINLGCGECAQCRAKLARHCANRTVLGIVKHPGAFRELLTLPEVNLRAVPRGVTLEQAVFAEPVAAACEILDQVKLPRGAEVAVLGDGKLGLLVAQVLALHGAVVHLYGHHRDKMAIAARAGVEPRITRQPKSAAYEWVVEATGSANGLEQAIAMAKPRGTVVLKSTVHGKTKLDAAAVVVNEITLVGSRCGRMEPALRLLASGKLHVDEMVSDRFPLVQARQAFTRAAERESLKVLLTV